MNSKIILASLFFANILIVMAMRPSGNELKHPSTPAGIVSLEFAFDSTRTHNIVNAWDNDISADINLVERAKDNILMDFVFLILYTFLLLAAIARWGIKAGKLQAIMKILSVTAGILDLSENLLMMRSLQGKISNFASLLTSAAAALKFTFIIVVIIYILWSLVTRKMRTQELHN